jgi:hypothetical protein
VTMGIINFRERGIDQGRKSFNNKKKVNRVKKNNGWINFGV